MIPAGQTNQRDRILAVAILIVAGVLVWYGAAQPYRAALVRSGAELSGAQAQLAVYRRIAQRRDTGAQTALPAAGNAGLLLPGATPATASAYLQQEIGAIAEASNVLVLSFEPGRSPGDTGLLTAIGGRVRLTADTVALRAFLHGLESHRPLLDLDNLFVRSRAAGGVVSGGNLDVQVDVTGYRAKSPELPEPRR